MKFYASFFNYGLKKVPVIIAEIEYEHSPDFDNTISNLYIDILQNCKFIVERTTDGQALITIYNTGGDGKATRPEFVFKVKKEFADRIQNELFFELHLYVTNGYLDDILEKHYLNTVLYKNRLCVEVAYNTQPVFNILDNEGKSLLKIAATKGRG